MLFRSVEKMTSVAMLKLIASILDIRYDSKVDRSSQVQAIKCAIYEWQKKAA